jgi:hypothetical protein
MLSAMFKSLSPLSFFRLPLLAILLINTSILFAQRTSHWGFVVRGGTYALPVNHQLFSDFDMIENDISAGYYLGAGVFAQHELSRWLSVSTELNYGFASFKKGMNLVCPTCKFIPNGKDYQQQSVFAPLKVHVGKGKQSLLSGFVGGGPFFAFFTEQQSFTYPEFENFFSAYPVEYENYKHYDRDVRWQWILNAGFSFRLNKQTRIGLETLFNPKPQFVVEELEDQEYPVLIRSICLSIYHKVR